MTDYAPMDAPRIAKLAEEMFELHRGDYCNADEIHDMKVAMLHPLGRDAWETFLRDQFANQPEVIGSELAFWDLYVADYVPDTSWMDD